MEKNYVKDEEGEITSIPLAIPSKTYIERIIKFLNSPDLNLEDEKTIEKIKDCGRQFGQVVRTDTNINNLRGRILEQLADCDSINLIIANARFPELNSIQLGGRDFENISSFFKEVFLKERQAKIWNEKINAQETIVDFIENKLDDYSRQISQQITERGIKDKIKLYIKDLTDIL